MNKLKDMGQLVEELKRTAYKHAVGSKGTGKSKGFFERLMNRLGWYRQSEWYFIDLNRVNFGDWGYHLPPKEITDKEKQ